MQKKLKKNIYSEALVQIEVAMCDFSKNISIIFVEGVIASGKTTIGEELERRGYPWLKEPVFEITHFGAKTDRSTGELLTPGINLLDHFQKYMQAQDQQQTLRTRIDTVMLRLEQMQSSDEISIQAERAVLVDSLIDITKELRECHAILEANTSGNPFSIQMAFFMTRVTSILRFVAQCKPGQTVFIERSPISDRFFFAMNLFLEKRMTPEEFETYCVIWDTFYKVIAPSFLRPDAFVYLRVSPEEALARVHERNRTGEEMMSIDYLADLHRVHEDFFNGDAHKAFAPVLSLDNTLDYRGSIEDTDEIVSKIVAFAQDITSMGSCKPQSLCEFTAMVDKLKDFTENVFSTSFNSKRMLDINTTDDIIQRIHSVLQ